MANNTAGAQFCEGRYGGLFRGVQEKGAYFPEYGSSFSAPIMFFVGIHMIIFWHTRCVATQLIAALLMANGIGSFVFHYTGRGWWGMYDANTMTILISVVFGSSWELFIELYTNKHYRRIPCSLRKVLRSLVAIAWLGVISSCIWLTGGAYTFNEVDIYDTVFFTHSAVMIVMSMSIAIAIVTAGLLDETCLSADARAETIKRLKLGIALILCGFLCWNMSEKLCSENSFFKMFPGHVAWHVSMTFGALNMLTMMPVAKASILHQRPTYLAGLYFRIVPGFRFEDFSANACRAYSQEDIAEQRADPVETRDAWTEPITFDVKLPSEHDEVPKAWGPSAIGELSEW